MNFTFLKNDSVAFFRSDAEQAEWTQQEFSMLCTFPADPNKHIERGMTVLFQDPATGDWQAYEIRNLTTFPGEGYQQFTAEDIAISELTDCHIASEIELTDVTAANALGRILPNTGWEIGTDTSSGTSVGDIGRGSVWEGVTSIRNNWNVNILPRVTVDENGITGRYLDIHAPEGTWRGLRLSIEKNCADPCVTYDDSDLYTALYGYGATTSSGTATNPKTEETDFSKVVWQKTQDHPAKPSGQKYLEWPEKTALYGRNGKPRFGYYQNTDIKDANTLLQKTWETLKTCSEPKISITGTITDLTRLGYKDVPLRIYDLAIVEVDGVQFYKQVIQLTVNLIDPTGNNVTIGDYIPNIIYINRETENYATGGSKSTKGGGGGRGGGGTRSQKKQGEFETSIRQNERTITLEAIQVDENRKKLKAAGIEIDPLTGVAIYAEDVPNGLGSKFKVTNNAITLEVTERKQSYNDLSSRITVNSREIELKVSKNGVISAINQTAESIQIKASRINLDGYVTTGQLEATNSRIQNLVTGKASFTQIVTAGIRASAFTFVGSTITTKSVTINGTTIRYLGW